MDDRMERTAEVVLIFFLLAALACGLTALYLLGESHKRDFEENRPPALKDSLKVLRKSRGSGDVRQSVLYLNEECQLVYAQCYGRPLEWHYTIIDEKYCPGPDRACQDVNCWQ